MDCCDMTRAMRVSVTGAEDRLGALEAICLDAGSRVGLDAPKAVSLVEANGNFGGNF